MTTDVTDLWHSIDDDITFERVRHMPRRTQFVSNHRKLSWQFDKEMKQVERDMKLSTVELSRARLVMTEKLTRLQDTKKHLVTKRIAAGGDSRRNSAPCLPLMDPCFQSDKAALHTHAHSTSSIKHVSSDTALAAMSKADNPKTAPVPSKSKFLRQNENWRPAIGDVHKKASNVFASQMCVE